MGYLPNSSRWLALILLARNSCHAHALFSVKDNMKQQEEGKNRNTHTHTHTHTHTEREREREREREKPCLPVHAQARV